MELPVRSGEDRFVPVGGYRLLSKQLADRPETARVPTLLVSCFDRRTRMLPFLLADEKMVPAGIRAVSAAMSNAGMTRQRVINQAWTPHVRPSQARIDGAAPEMLIVSSMQIHSAMAYQQIRDALRMGRERPLIICGGPKAIYQPWDYFHFDDQGSSADVVCTGEEFVLLELLDRLYDAKESNESMLTAFERAKRRGWLDDIPGLMFMQNDPKEGNPFLVDTGVQRLLRDFDELPWAVDGYRYLERPHRKTTLASRPVGLSEVHKYCNIASILTTRGCKFRCGYCPIPAYNQFSFRTRSPESLVRDIGGIRRHVGINLFFGTDDNFFNDEKTVVDTFEALAKAEFEKDDIGKAARFGTEATEFDVHKQLDVLPLCYRGGLRAIWFGIEDLTAQLVNKGQSVTKTEQLFAEMRKQRILPMAMMMHYDGQPLVSKGSMDGILNQVRFLFKAGAASVQVTVLGPAAGTKDYDEVLQKGIIFKTLAGQKVEDHYWDGNHVISVGTSQPWKLQRDVLLSYATFYNPVNLVRALLRPHRKWSDIFLQLWGMWGLGKTAWQLVPWMLKLRAAGKKQYTVWRDVPKTRLPIRPPEFGASHERAKEYIPQATPATGETKGKKAVPSKRASLLHY